MTTPRGNFDDENHTSEPIDETILSADHTKDRINKMLKEVRVLACNNMSVWSDLRVRNLHNTAGIFGHPGHSAATSCGDRARSY